MSLYNTNLAVVGLLGLTISLTAVMIRSVSFECEPVSLLINASPKMFKHGDIPKDNAVRVMFVR